MGSPCVQSTYMKQFAGRVLLLGSRAERVVELDPELFEAIEAAGRMTWLPVELNVRIIDALYAGLGPRRAHEFQAEQISAQLGTPLWRGLVEGGVRLLGLDPGVLARWIPPALGLIFRDCGTWTVERTGSESVALCVRGLPEVLGTHPRWLDSVAGGVHALFMICKTTGETEVTEVDAAAGTARIAIRWKPVLG